MPDRYVVANWKMNLPPEGIEAYVEALNRIEGGAARIVVAPPYPSIQRVAGSLKEGHGTASQNCADHEKGAFTGEVAPSMVHDAGARFVILGHSERRSIYGETDATVARKMAIAISAGLTPILCIGEDLRTRDSGNTARVLADQVRAAAVGVGGGNVILAYEPVWAIGTGRNASGTMVAETVAHIRDSLERFWPEGAAKNTPVLYGGSVTPDNVVELVRHGDIQGFLVGGASLDSAKFTAIHRALA
jgi:triosephosphate isomerase